MVFAFLNRREIFFVFSKLNNAISDPQIYTRACISHDLVVSFSMLESEAYNVYREIRFLDKNHSFPQHP